MIFLTNLKWIYGNGGSFFIFLFFKPKFPSQKLINHERIHFMQQLELLFVGMWIIYVVNLFINMLKYKEMDKAYRNVIFEREAHTNDTDLQYLINRRIFRWTKYIRG